jgi:hypothetical protein
VKRRGVSNVASFFFVADERLERFETFAHWE